MDAVTNYYTLAGLKQYTYIFLKFWRPEVQNQVQYTEIKCEWGLPLSGSTRGEAVPCFWRLPVAATLPWLENTRLRCSIVTSGLYSQISLFSLRRTLMTAFRAHLDNPGLYPHHPPLFFFSFLPYAVAFTSCRDLDTAVFERIIIQCTTPFVKRSNIKIHFLKVNKVKI